MILHEGLWKWRSSHKTKLQIQWEKSSPLCKYMRTIYSPLLSYQGLFSASGRKKRKEAAMAKWIYSDWCARQGPGANGQLPVPWIRLLEKSFPETTSLSALWSNWTHRVDVGRDSYPHSVLRKQARKGQSHPVKMPKYQYLGAFFLTLCISCEKGSICLSTQLISQKSDSTLWGSTNEVQISLVGFVRKKKFTP